METSVQVVDENDLFLVALDMSTGEMFILDPETHEVLHGFKMPETLEGRMRYEYT